MKTEEKRHETVADASECMRVHSGGTMEKTEAKPVEQYSADVNVETELWLFRELPAGLNALFLWQASVPCIELARAYAAGLPPKHGAVLVLATVEVAHLSANRFLGELRAAINKANLALEAHAPGRPATVVQERMARFKTLADQVTPCIERLSALRLQLDEQKRVLP